MIDTDAPAPGNPGVHAVRDTPAQRASARLIEWLDPPHDYNLRHFRLRHMVAELLRTLRGDGVLPGARRRILTSSPRVESACGCAICAGARSWCTWSATPDRLPAAEFCR